MQTFNQFAQTCCWWRVVPLYTAGKFASLTPLFLGRPVYPRIHSPAPGSPTGNPRARCAISFRLDKRRMLDNRGTRHPRKPRPQPSPCWTQSFPGCRDAAHPVPAGTSTRSAENSKWSSFGSANRIRTGSLLVNVRETERPPDDFGDEALIGQRGAQCRANGVLVFALTAPYKVSQ